MVDVDVAKRKLVEALGGCAEKYWSNMKLWYKQKISKDDFDTQAFEFLGPGKINYHNEFIISILAKCEMIAYNMPNVHSQKAVKGNAKSSHLCKPHVRRSNLSPVPQVIKPFIYDDGFDAIPTIIPKGEDQDLSSCSQDLVLPDTSSIHGRLFLCAWDVGLESLSENCASAVVYAVETMLRNVLSACVARRKSCELREGSHFPYRFGHVELKSDMLNERLASNSYHPKNQKHYTHDQAEALAHTKLSCGSLEPFVKSPISVFTLRDTITELPHILPSLSLRLTCLEQIANYLWHPSTEELHQNKMYILDTRKVHKKIKQQRALRTEFLKI